MELAALQGVILGSFFGALTPLSGVLGAWLVSRSGRGRLAELGGMLGPVCSMGALMVLLFLLLTAAHELSLVVVWVVAAMAGWWAAFVACHAPPDRFRHRLGLRRAASPSAITLRAHSIKCLLLAQLAMAAFCILYASGNPFLWLALFLIPMGPSKPSTLALTDDLLLTGIGAHFEGLLPENRPKTTRWALVLSVGARGQSSAGDLRDEYASWVLSPFNGILPVGCLRYAESSLLSAVYAERATWRVGVNATVTLALIAVGITSASIVFPLFLMTLGVAVNAWSTGIGLTIMILIGFALMLLFGARVGPFGGSVRLEEAYKAYAWAYPEATPQDFIRALFASEILMDSSDGSPERILGRFHRNRAARAFLEGRGYSPADLAPSLEDYLRQVFAAQREWEDLAGGKTP